MAPRTGLALDESAAHYMPADRLTTWDEYDEKLEEYGEALKEVPILLIMEPSLLMHTFNSETEYHNTEFQSQFSARVQGNLSKYFHIHMFNLKSLFTQFSPFEKCTHHFCSTPCSYIGL